MSKKCLSPGCPNKAEEGSNYCQEHQYEPPDGLRIYSEPDQNAGE